VPMACPWMLPVSNPNSTGMIWFLELGVERLARSLVWNRFQRWVENLMCDNCRSLCYAFRFTLDTLLVFHLCMLNPILIVHLSSRICKNSEDRKINLLGVLTGIYLYIPPHILMLWLRDDVEYIPTYVPSSTQFSMS